MELYHYYFFFIKFLIIIMTILILFNKSPFDGKYYILIESIFKISLGLFIILYFYGNNCNNLNYYDRLLIIITGFILIFTVKYKNLYNLYINKK